MAFYFLPNTIADVATTMTFGTAASGYNKFDLIAGPRSTYCRSTSTTSNGFGYESPTDMTLTHLVIARADWMLTKGGTNVFDQQLDSGSTWHSVSNINKTPLASTDLMGIRSQDIAVAISQSYLRGNNIIANSVAGSQAMQISKLYFSNGVNIGAPKLGLEFQPLPEDTFATPPEGMIPYQVEGRFGLVFENLSDANATAFRGITQLKNWPLFLFDDAGDNWPWKLEHVILDGYSEEIPEKGIHTITATFFRLRHDD